MSTPSRLTPSTPDAYQAITDALANPDSDRHRVIAQLCLDYDVLVDDLREQIAELSARESKCTCGGPDPDEHRPQGVTTWGGW